MAIIIVQPGQDIQAAINRAQAGDTVYLKPGMYLLANRLTLKSDLILVGEYGTILKAGPSTGGVVRGKVSDGWLYGNNLVNVEIAGLRMSSTATGILDGGLGETRNCIMLLNCAHFKIHDCQVEPYVYNDFVKCKTGNDIKVFNNKGQCGHDFVQFLSNSHDCEAYNNDVVIQTNCGMRIDNGKNIRLHHNVFTGIGGSGWCIFEIENNVTDCEIDHNICHDFRGSSGSNVTQPVHAIVKNLNVHDNVIWACGTIAAGTSTNNIINPTGRIIVDWQAKGYGPALPTPVTPPVVPVKPVTPPIVPPKPVIKEVIVGFNKKGTYNCIGTQSNAIDAPVIQSAIKFALDNKIPVVKLTGPHSYYINAPLNVPDGVKLIGTPGAQLIWNF